MTPRSRPRRMPMLLRWSMVPLLLIALASSLVFAPAHALVAQVDPAMQVLALVNQWRIQEGLWPLRVNTTLMQMALDQVTYIQPKLASIKDELEYHLDAQGRTPPTRAMLSYGWPAYRKATPKVFPVEIGENAADGSAQFAVNFWKTSNIHRKAALSTVYREVGVAALPSQFGYIFIMDFGARPGILTPLLSVSGNTLYIPNENSGFASLQPNQMQIRVLDADGDVVADTMAWKVRLLSSAGFTKPLTVQYTNGSYSAHADVDPAQDTAVLPGAPARGGAVSTAVTPASPTPSNTAPASIGATASPTPLPNTSTPSASPAPSATSTSARASPTATLLVQPDVILFYNSRSLVIFNNAGKPVDLTGFSVGSSTVRISITSWTTVATFLVNAFPSASCLQVLQLGATDAAPSQCKFVRSQITVSAARVFWAKSQFTVNRGDTVLATCDAAAGRCNVKL